MRADARWLVPVVLSVTGCAVADPAVTARRWFVAAPMPEALQALAGNDRVQVETREGLVFRPRENPGGAGLVVHAGGYADPRAYAPRALALAARGHVVALPRMPFGLAFSNADAGTTIRQAFPEVRRWAVIRWEGWSRPATPRHIRTGLPALCCGRRIQPMAPISRYGRCGQG